MVCMGFGWGESQSLLKDFMCALRPGLLKFIQLSLIRPEDLRASVAVHSPLTETDNSDQDFPLTRVSPPSDKKSRCSK